MDPKIMFFVIAISVLQPFQPGDLKAAVGSGGRNEGSHFGHNSSIRRTPELLPAPDCPIEAVVPLLLAAG
jgi:hypothetical protein